MRTWIEPTLPPTIDEALLDACADDELLARILLARGLTNAADARAFLDPDAYHPTAPETIPDLERASAVLNRAIAEQKRILIWGDFDVDGQTATALLLDGLRRLGATVDFYIPNRVTESHGMKVASLERQIALQNPDLLLTCDTGISEFKAVDYARAYGLPVIITDHHDLPPSLPNADAVVNPKRLEAVNPRHPLITLPGVGVAYMLMQHLYTTCGRARELPRLLDLVALGIVGDVAMQVNDTRYLLQLGMERLQRPERPGLQALIEVCNIAPETMTADRIGFQLGPRLNAVGRLGDASLAVELLTTSDRGRAAVIAQQMDGLNNERKLLSRQIEDAAEAVIQQDRSVLNFEALVIYQPGWHAGILGVVANRLIERYFRPVVLLTSAEQPGDSVIAVGSARAPEGYDLHAALSVQADLLRTFGGHMGAAGLSLVSTQVDILRHRLSKTLAQMGATLSIPPLVIDAIVTLDQVDQTLAKRLERLAPFGEGNPTPVLMTPNLHLSHAGIVGRDQRHLKLVAEDDNGLMQTIMWWDGAGHHPPESRFDAAYTIRVNDRAELEAVLVDLREYEAVEVHAPEELALNIHDWRRDSAQAAEERLNTILAETPDVLIWAEAYPRAEHPTWKRRAELMPSQTLAIFSAPSDPSALENALKHVDPQTVHVFGVEPPIASFEAFLRQLVMAAKNAIEHLNGVIPLVVLCGATAQSEQSVRAGLEFLSANGQIRYDRDASAGELIQLAASADTDTPADRQEVKVLYDSLRRAYEEAEAYRRFFRTMPIKRVLLRE